MDLIFNELSLLPLAPSRDEAGNRVRTFLATIRSAIKKGISRQLRTKEAFKDSLLAAGYSWRDGLNDPSISKEERDYLRSLVTRAPLLDGLNEAQEQAENFEFFVGNDPVEGLGVAFMTGNLSISLLSDGRWDHAHLPLKIRELQEDGDIREYEQTLRHISRGDHVNQHQIWIQEILKKSVADGAELWERSATYFPSLEFCPVVREQMENLPQEAVTPILHALFCLEEYCQGWQEGGFNQEALGCLSSTESQTTKERFGGERTFTCPDGNDRLFSYHIKRGQLWRIYYDPAPGPGKMYVGYVGRHLKTTRFDH